MPKYRLLTSDELENLKDDFVDFLVVNGIGAEDWSRIKTTNLTKAQGITAQFSDVVFEKILRQKMYLMHRTEQSMSCFHYQEKQAVMIGVKCIKGKLVLDTNLSTSLLKGDCEILTGEKKYTQQRELEMFDMIKKGAELTEGEWYKKLALLL